MSLVKQILKIVTTNHKYNTYHTLNKSHTKLTRLSQNYISQRFNPNVCWKCGLERKNLLSVFCSECYVIQNPQETENYFRLLNLDEKFDIDTKELRNKYRALQSHLHPDKFTNKSKEEQSISANYSSLVNKAYSNLQVPLKRAEHLLQLKGDKLGEEQTLDDPEFLMEMMELNEELDNISDIEELKKFNIKNKNQLEIIAKSIDECFRKNDLKQAKAFVIKMKYYSSLGNRINGLLREKGVVD
ncbi:unnamed protein product [Ceutorhynchus assimilis]|uniref:J domain-containing protein n=1 Tax=Ceutorhynchus assimilis TaxID=467358 RepID=A0A9N9QAJ2_9CUCU|nr:unnamed protein product [Ceutorhynchus assimilis]